MNIGLGDKRRLILLIDSDPHARHGLRLVLEQAGFSVGEAVNDREAERVCAHLRPDAVLAELISGDSGHTIAEKLHAQASGIPCYILRSASDALMGSVGLHELGVSGVFLKPVDAALVVQTLKTRLGVGALA